MNIITKLNLSAPIIFVNPYFNQDCGLINAVTKLGGIGVLDLATADCSSFMSNVMAPFAVRVHPDDNFLSEMADQIKLAIIPFEGWNKMLSFPEGTFSNFPFPVLVEVGSAEQGIKAEKLGAQGLIVRGNEGSGWVSPIHGFVLLQRVLEITTLPVFLQGGVGPCTASGAIKAGASGIVLDHHLLLTKESAIHGDFKNFLANLSLSASTTLNEISGHPFRVYSRIGTRKVRELKKLEQSITEEQFPDYYTTILKSIGFPTALP
ncbi:MAG: nitronate monooxygenase, partial [Desulfomonilaceae bacterium]